MHDSSLYQKAETKYADLASEDKHIGWRYFKSFKMQLFNEVILFYVDKALPTVLFELKLT